MPEQEPQEPQEPKAKAKVTPPAAPPSRPESVFTKDEIIRAARGYGVSAELMAGALHYAGLATATRSQAEAAVKAFRRLRF